MSSLLPFDDPVPPTPSTESQPPSPPRPDVAAPIAAPARSAAPEPEPRRVSSVTELTARLRTLIESQFSEVWVEGEISNCHLWNTGHLYFTLKDAGAQIKAVMFRSSLRALRFKPQDGLRVVARGRIGVYAPKGEYQIVCEQLEPAGLGALQLAVDQLKRRLAAEGLFDAARKRPLPSFPRKIGIVTSLDGAALRDILKVLHRRYPDAHVIIAPTRVQGEGAATEISRALAGVAAVPGVEVIIVGRGGGSIEDLWAFNEEAVARALAACPVPTISAVGHETDVTVADFVADLRAPTPSAAAELVVARKDEFHGRIDRLTHRLAAAIRLRGHRFEARLRALEARPGFGGFRAHLAMRGRHAADLTHALRQAMRASLAAHLRSTTALRLRVDAHDPRRRVSALRTRLVAADARLSAGLVRRQHASDSRFRALMGRLESLSPLAVLGRGYAVCFAADGATVLRDASRVPNGTPVRVRLNTGTLDCRVTGHTTETGSGHRS